MAKVLIALGANIRGRWGAPDAALAKALKTLQSPRFRLSTVSPLYRSDPIGQPGQEPYANAVALFETALPPEAVLRLLKQTEAKAGRRGEHAPWGPRSLDLDLLDYAGQVRGWDGEASPFARAGKRPLILPHPQAQHRPFVIRPLADIAPHWRHPVLHKTASRLWRDLLRQGQDGGLLPANWPASNPGNT
ncbi:2-amino-4-hydroxy-6-hydroxymethyldihydropteridine diphosphokinase [Methyloligella sp. 2.7D]|uniref:2-amino-4-hydroxy-6- hydroxymethyldihydropteridine diphosphokinase n=1 Tax=unclassified Methyloligella TaxID=2625955 RepID=UPI00157BDEBA|nr:2-amino-4-hydroxy-6-hydroxymethyldihydropteridine diphosphokinase [Methyloligella sp. GL2]QKP77618.1 2-amino-4-hydroxy-6-hydroxymethyldihydropteridine diphosphokinase [Methyloligella sp. GL2]